ncbi:cell wall hydrolase [Lentibacillus sp. CBA3610]|uniref:cell wall hydrolase n=1 Tax=Lentibacillus sp. CBA3610 TaxID=2518176 RepID=UPI0015963770|nr:cell wall hydrolase [Lentibacillus sp. CBA3610]QKY68772.1 LysM peptidoglycan-binding domain-containing protein [Lentibacillus sp. CBA3610]
MRKLNKLFLAGALSLSIMAVPASVGASSYTVQQGESFHSIANEHGITLSNLQIANKNSGSQLMAGETIRIPDSVSHEDKELMAKLVHAEAKGEPYEGKVAVATVVLNRVDSNDFPDTVKGVIYEKVGGHYAFSPVKNGAINQGYTDEDMQAVNEAVAFRGQGNGSLYFYNPDKVDSDWVLSRDTIVKIGDHRFAK